MWKSYILLLTTKRRNTLFICEKVIWINLMCCFCQSLKVTFKILGTPSHDSLSVTRVITLLVDSQIKISIVEISRSWWIRHIWLHVLLMILNPIQVLFGSLIWIPFHYVLYVVNVPFSMRKRYFIFFNFIHYHEN